MYEGHCAISTRLFFLTENNHTRVFLTSNFVNNSHQVSLFMSPWFLTSLCVIGIDFFQHIPVEVNTAFVQVLALDKGFKSYNADIASKNIKYEHRRVCSSSFYVFGKSVLFSASVGLTV